MLEEGEQCLASGPADLHVQFRVAGRTSPMCLAAASRSGSATSGRHSRGSDWASAQRRPTRIVRHPAPGSSARHDVLPRVADEPGTGQVGPQVRRGLQQQPRGGLATRACNPAGVDAIGQVGAGVEAGQLHARLRELRDQELPDLMNGAGPMVAACHARLVRGDHHVPPVRAQNPKPLA